MVARPERGGTTKHRVPSAPAGKRAAKADQDKDRLVRAVTRLAGHFQCRSAGEPGEGQSLTPQYGAD